MNALMQGLGCLGCLDSSDDASEAPAAQSSPPAAARVLEAPTEQSARVVETELRARDDGTRNYRLERRAVAWACEDAVRRCANAAVDAALDESLRDALDARLGLKDEMAAKPLVLMETDDLVVMASEEMAIRALMGREVESRDPFEREVLTWQV